MVTPDQLLVSPNQMEQNGLISPALQLQEQHQKLQHLMNQTQVVQYSNAKKASKKLLQQQQAKLNHTLKRPPDQTGQPERNPVNTTLNEYTSDYNTSILSNHKEDRKGSKFKKNPTYRGYGKKHSNRS